MKISKIFPHFHKKKGGTKRKKILDFIENNAKKSEFINWLNTQHSVVFSEKSDWEDIKKEIYNKKEVATTNLQIYAASLSSEEDIKKLLQDVEEETQKAKQVVTKLSYLSGFKKFSIMMGGALILEGLVFFVFGVGFFLQIVDFGFTENLNLYTAAIVSLLGLLNITAGLLLATR